MALISGKLDDVYVRHKYHRIIYSEYHGGISRRWNASFDAVVRGRNCLGSVRDCSFQNKETFKY